VKGIAVERDLPGKARTENAQRDRIFEHERPVEQLVRGAQ
jgi:hypothetical protein